ncbi:MAG TPA: Wzz/FepE/Etk N-terminal domain-containing protein [Patescibacteria group bacterium]|nr:Wzz/FepE/Etk N-terminal domain-containing protein [Patescibacteria group bacterium]
MELSGYFAVARRWWWTLLVAAWVAGLAGFYVAGRIAPTYESQVKLLVGPINADADTLRSSGQLVQTYAQVVTTPTVINEAIKQTGAIGVSSGALANTTRVIANDQTRILTIRVQDGDPVQAAKLANGIANQMVLISNSGLARPEGSLQIIQDAVPVPDPVAPQVSLIVLLATFAGIVAAVILILLIEYLSTSIRTREELARFTRIPVLGSVPAAAKSQPHPKDLIDESSAAATVYRVLAARIVYGDSTEILHSIAVVDTETDTGASVVAVNLSRALARLGRRVVLIDGGDHGGLARLFRVDPVPGIRDVLNREAQPRTALRMVSERLALLPSGPSAGDVVDPDRAKALIHELLAYADVVVVAATPVQSGPGALAWARAVEGTVLIARRDHAKREDVAAAAETLLHVGGNLVGAILAERAAPLAGLFGRGRSGSSRSVSAAPPRGPMAAPGPSNSAPPPVEPPYASTSYRPTAPPPGTVSSTPPASAQPPASTLRPSIIRASGSGPAPEPTIIPSPVSASTAAPDAPVAGTTPVAAEPLPSPKRSTTTRSTTSRSRSTSRSSTSRSDPNSAP